MHTNLNAPNVPARGFAMMLVIIALAVVTISVSAYLASQENAPDVSDNVVRAVVARAAAETGLEITSAIMASESINWRARHEDGVLIAGYQHGDGQITVRVVDLDGNPPDDDSEYLVLQSVGVVAGLEQVAEADVYASNEQPLADYTLREFATFGTEIIKLDVGSITRWEASPLAERKEPVRIGTNSVNSGAVSIFTDGEIVDGVLYVREDASSSVFSDMSGFGRSIRRVEMTGTNPIPLPDAPLPIVADLSMSLFPDPEITFGDWPVIFSEIYNSLTVSGSARLLCRADQRRVVILGDLVVRDGGEILVEAANNIDIVVIGDLIVERDAAIHVDHGCSLRLFVGGDITLSDAVMGFPRVIATQDGRDPRKGIRRYFEPWRFQVYHLDVQALLDRDGDDGLSRFGVEADDSPRRWDIDDRSFVRGVWYANGKVDVMLEDNSALFGNLVARKIWVKRGSVIHYDHQLDRRGGFSNHRSFVYRDDRSLNDAVLGMAVNLEDTTIAAVDDYVKQVEAPRSSRKLKEFRRRLKRIGLDLHHDKRD